jgi:hypothetical protein
MDEVLKIALEREVTALVVAPPVEIVAQPADESRPQ